MTGSAAAGFGEPLDALISAVTAAASSGDATRLLDAAATVQAAAAAAAGGDAARPIIRLPPASPGGHGMSSFEVSCRAASFELLRGATPTLSPAPAGGATYVPLDVASIAASMSASAPPVASCSACTLVGAPGDRVCRACETPLAPASSAAVPPPLHVHVLATAVEDAAVGSGGDGTVFVVAGLFPDGAVPGDSLPVDLVVAAFPLRAAGDESTAAAVSPRFVRSVRRSFPAWMSPRRPRAPASDTGAAAVTEVPRVACGLQAQALVLAPGGPLLVLLAPLPVASSPVHMVSAYLAVLDVNPEPLSGPAPAITVAAGGASVDAAIVAAACDPALAPGTALIGSKAAVATTVNKEAVDFAAVAVHPHPLVPRSSAPPDSSGPVLCGLCKAEGPPAAHVFCEACNYAECSDCRKRTSIAAAAALSLRRAVHPHPLQLFTGSTLPPQYKRCVICDLCRAKQVAPNVVATWHCSQCKYDECGTCFASTSAACAAAATPGAEGDADDDCGAAPLWIDIVASPDLAPALAGRRGAALLAPRGVLGKPPATSPSTFVVACELCPATGANAAEAELLEVTFSLSPSGGAAGDAGAAGGASAAAPPLPPHTYLLRRLRAQRSAVERPAAAARALLLHATAAAAPAQPLPAALVQALVPAPLGAQGSAAAGAAWWVPAPVAGPGHAPVSLARLAVGADTAVAVGNDGSLFVLAPQDSPSPWLPLAAHARRSLLTAPMTAAFSPAASLTLTDGNSRVVLDDGKWALSEETFVVDAAAEAVLTWAFKVDIPGDGDRGENPEVGFGLATMPHDGSHRETKTGYVWLGQGGIYNCGFNRGSEPKFTHGDTVHFRLDFATGVCEGRKGDDGEWIKMGKHAPEDFRGRSIKPAVFAHGNKKGAVFSYLKLTKPTLVDCGDTESPAAMRSLRVAKQLQPLAIGSAQALGGVARSAHNLPHSGDVLAGGAGALVHSQSGVALSLERGSVSAPISALAALSNHKTHVSVIALPSRSLLSDDTIDECGAVAFVAHAPQADPVTIICDGDDRGVPLLFDSPDGGAHFRVVALDKRQMSAAAPEAPAGSRALRQPLKPLAEAARANKFTLPLIAAAAAARRSIKPALAWLEKQAKALVTAPRSKAGARLQKTVVKKLVGEVRCATRRALRAWLLTSRVAAPCLGSLL